MLARRASPFKRDGFSLAPNLANTTVALTWGRRGLNSHVATFFGEDMPDTTCVFCGNCVGVCPTGALKGLVEWKTEQHEG